VIVTIDPLISIAVTWFALVAVVGVYRCDVSGMDRFKFSMECNGDGVAVMGAIRSAAPAGCGLG